MPAQKATNNMPASNEHSAKRTKNIKSNSKDKNKNSAGKQGSGNKNSGAKSQRDEVRCLSKSTSSIIGQAMKN